MEEGENLVRCGIRKRESNCVLVLAAKRAAALSGRDLFSGFQRGGYRDECEASGPKPYQYRHFERPGFLVPGLSGNSRTKRTATHNSRSSAQSDGPACSGPEALPRLPGDTTGHQPGQTSLS